ncbi:hypothetical protein R1flu_018762 [Riccia fluitans]|uniref:Uncharacterized protein n=1 Tax=Riccia fluitans TaxID=41844 RepID=A0ABD1ZK90_9MARC
MEQGLQESGSYMFLLYNPSREGERKGGRAGGPSNCYEYGQKRSGVGPHCHRRVGQLLPSSAVNLHPASNSGLASLAHFLTGVCAGKRDI